MHIPGVGWQPVPVVARASLQPGQSLWGQLIPEATGCTVLEPGWTAAADGLGNRCWNTRPGGGAQAQGG